ncbi:MAG TPA: gas vesicle protein GvpG [Thermoanaerobaculia bacterium]|nr:gas vesicle protein GvpG [Thermoanaerobaculia bacterium]
MIVVDRLLYGGLRFILNQLAAATDQELDAEGLLQEELLIAQMRLELEEITEEELAAIEAEILPRLRESREGRQAGTGRGAGGRVVGVEVSFGGDTEKRSSGRR